MSQFPESGPKQKRTKMTEAMMYNPRVAKSDKTMFRKIWLVNTLERLSPWSAADRFEMPLNANRKAATYNNNITSMNNLSKVIRIEKEQNRHVNRNARKPNHSHGVTPLRALRSVTER
jgi:hypothetical protein